MSAAVKVFVVLSVLLTICTTAAFFEWNSGHRRPVSVKLIADERMAKRIIPAIIPLFATMYDVPKQPKKVTKIVVFVSPYKPVAPSVGFKYVRQGNAQSRPIWLARRPQDNYGYQ